MDPLDRELEEINQEIKYIQKLQAHHNDLAKSQSRIHKGMQDIWRNQVQNQKDAKDLIKQIEDRHKMKSALQGG